MIKSDYSSDGEYAVTVAATAYAINSIEEEKLKYTKDTTEGFGRTLSRTKSKKHEKIVKPIDSSKSISRWFSSKEDREGESPMMKPSTFEKTARGGFVLDRNPTGRVPDNAPSMKKKPTFTDKYPNEIGNKNFEGGKEIKEKPSTSSNINPIPFSSGKGKQQSYPMRPNIRDSEADAWEKAELEKIMRRYEKTRTTIMEWEDEKKTKARRRMRKKESEIEMRRSRALQEYHDEIIRIDNIAGGARALADERRRNKESKVFEKAKMIRSTGRVPRACFCF